jgi:hypothetical protein
MMAGNNGKMTREAIKDRGPRFVLGTLLKLEDLHVSQKLNEEATATMNARAIGMIIYQSTKPPFLEAICGRYGLMIHSRSYSLSYLRNIVRCMRIKP